MPQYTFVLCCSVLFCSVLWCAVLFCAVLCGSVLCCSVRFCSVLCCSVLSYSVLFCAVLCVLLYVLCVLLEVLSFHNFSVRVTIRKETRRVADGEQPNQRQFSGTSSSFARRWCRGVARASHPALWFCLFTFYKLCHVDFVSSQLQLLENAE